MPVIFLAILFAFVTPAMAQTAADIPAPLLQHIQRRLPIERYVTNLLDFIRDNDVDHDGLDANDIERVRLSHSARSRAARFETFFTLDLNNDFQVTPDEAKSANTYELDRWWNDLRKDDANSDQTLSFEEVRNIMANADSKKIFAPSDGIVYVSGDGFLVSLLALDPSGDGRLTIAEAETLARDAFAKISTDGDDILSPEEYAAARQRDSQKPIGPKPSPAPPAR